MKKLIQTILMVFVGYAGIAQCAAGEAEVTVVVHTDNYGNEGYWQLLPSGNSCGTGMIAQGGNTTVGCNGAGAQNNPAGGYANNTQITEGPWCIATGTPLDFIYTDDYGDGGFSFDILVNGYQIATFDGMALGATFNFTVEEPAPYDLALVTSNIYSYVTTGSFNLETRVFNNGTNTVTSYDLNYSIDGGAPSTHNVALTTLPNFEEEDVAHSIPVSITSNGVYTIKIWADNINGNNDGNNANDTLTRQIEAGPGTPNILDQYIGAPLDFQTIAGASNQVNSPTDLDFHPVLSNMELWVVNKGIESVGGSTVTIYEAGNSAQSTLYKKDANSWHFMSLPTGIAFSQNGNWANSPGVYDANHNGGDAFTGPSLWSSDMSIYAQPSGGNGSHLDMLHASPYSQGIAAEKDNVFWVFDGNSSDIVRYDFADDHGPGNAFHGDAIIRRYSDDQVQKDPNDQIVSHLAFDEDKKWLYAVDHGNQRVFRIDITTGSNMGGTPLYTPYETIVEYSAFTGYTQESVVTGLSKPAGIDVVGDRMIVSEYQSGEIIIYDISTMPAVELERISTGYSSVQGITVGPAGRIWFVDQNSNGVYKIDSPGFAGTDDVKIKPTFSVYPNPSNGTINVRSNMEINGTIEVRNIQGQLVHTEAMLKQTTSMNLNAASGLYFVSVIENGLIISTDKVTIK